MDLFLNPWAMAAGGAMISAPILIHLINRMRFKRIRWAAMEFLLKSQKRNRRRLIIEQIILLMLRCLLILLAGLLLAEYIGPPFRQKAEDRAAAAKKQKPGTLHVALVDDTLSMTDRTPKEKGSDPDCISMAKRRLKELVQRAEKADSNQYLRVVLLSTKEVVFEGDLKDGEVLGKAETFINGLKPRLLHAKPQDGLAKCKETLALLPNQQAKEAAKADQADKEKKDKKDEKGDKEKPAEEAPTKWLKRLHVYSDFRDSDWGRRESTEPLYKVLDEITRDGTSVSMVDTAAPQRQPDSNVSIDYHNNYAITDLRPEKRVAPGNTNVNFTVEIVNHGRDIRESLLLEVFLDGQPDFVATKQVPAPEPGGDPVRHTFEILFEAPEQEVASKTHRVTVRLPQVDDELGLLADNVRHTTIEIRREVPTLVIDGAGDRGLQPGGDTRVIKDALESAKGSETTKIVTAGLKELDRNDLAQEYATIYLVNLENLKNPDAKKGEENVLVERLRKFVRDGGNIVFFSGPNIDVDYYNKTLFESAQGLFPVPLEKQVVNKPDEKELEARLNSRAPKVYVLEPNHPITQGIAPLQFDIPDLLIPQYTPTKPRFEWGTDDKIKFPWNKKEDLKELMTLATLQKLTDGTRGQVAALLRRLPIDDPKFAKYKEALSKHKLEIEKLLLGGRGDDVYQLFRVGQAIDAMLKDKGSQGAAKDKEDENVSLVEFWARRENQDLKEDIQTFRRDALYGAPLVLSRKVGKGNVVAFLTTAGTAWSGWSGGPKGGVSSFTFPMIMVDLQKFLTSGSSGGQLLGEEYRIELDARQYKNQLRRYSQTEETAIKPGAVGLVAGIPAGFEDEGEMTGQLVNGKWVFTFPAVSKPGQPGVDRPGVNIFRIPFSKKEGYEYRWVTFNVDTENESNLRRAATGDLTRSPTDAPSSYGSIKMYNQDDPFDPSETPGAIGVKKKEKKEQEDNLSTGPWLFLLFLLILVAEQALAVHLSFHASRNQPAL
jgi:hypothetical protein